jgi:hypothetical protein
VEELLRHRSEHDSSDRAVATTADDDERSATSLRKIEEFVRGISRDHVEGPSDVLLAECVEGPFASSGSELVFRL